MIEVSDIENVAVLMWSKSFKDSNNTDVAIASMVQGVMIPGKYISKL